MRRHLPLSISILLLAAACGEAASDKAGGDGGGGDLAPCTRDADCPAGLVCGTDGICVTEDGTPPERERPRDAVRPEASAERIFILSPSADAVTLLDPSSLALKSVGVPAEPIDLEVLPGEDAALILSGAGRSLSLLHWSGGGPALHVQRIDRRFGAVAVDPTGARAILWNPDGSLPADGAEGVVGIVDLAALRDDAPAPIAELAVGRRHAAVFFRGGEDAVVVGKEEIAVLSLAAEPAATRIALPASFAEPSTREAVAAADGSFLLMRSLAAAEILVFDVAARTLATLPLPAPATDLDLSADGTLAAAVLRSSGQIAFLDLPAALGDPGAVRLYEAALPAEGCEAPPCTTAAGQVELAADGSLAVLFSSAAPTESVVAMRTADGSLLGTFHLEKRPAAVFLTPDATRAVIFLQADPGSTVSDPYEREVDRSEGYAVVDLEGGFSQLKLTGTRVPREVVFAPGDRWAAVSLREADGPGFGLDAIDLQSLLTTPLPLASAPEFLGPLPAENEETLHRIWVTQVHPAGRIGIARLDRRSIRHITGFELESEVP